MYAFRAALYCDDCGAKIKGLLDADGKQDTGDSEEYPQYADEDHSETDCPNHCEGCEELIVEALTTDGLAYVARAIVEYITTGRGDSDIIEQWATEYSLDSVEALRGAFKAVR